MILSNIVGQVLIVVSYVLFWISRFCKNKSSILTVDSISRIFRILGFYTYGSLNGVQSACFNIFRNLIINLCKHKSKGVKVFTYCGLLVFLLIMFFMSFNGISTLLVLTCSVINLTGVFWFNPQGIRVASMLGNSFYLGYLVTISNYSGVICEVICFFITLISWLKYHEVPITKTTKQGE